MLYAYYIKASLHKIVKRLFFKGVVVWRLSVFQNYSQLRFINDRKKQEKKNLLIFVLYQRLTSKSILIIYNFVFGEECTIQIRQFRTRKICIKNNFIGLMKARRQRLYILLQKYFSLSEEEWARLLLHLQINMLNYKGRLLFRFLCRERYISQ